MNRLVALRAVLLASVSLPMLAYPANAQEETGSQEVVPEVEYSSPDDIEDAVVMVEPTEMVVTARRRSETLFDVPASVTAVSGQALRDAGITDVKDIIGLIPNAVIPDSADNSNVYVNIRGIRQADLYAEPNFGLYRNGIFYGGARSNLGPQVDIDRVEVLRGPQGGLYGRNALGGALNIVYATPTNELGGYVRASYGRYDRKELEGAINAPVSNRFSTRIAGWIFDQDEGEYYNVTLGQEIDEQQDKGLRFSARANLTDDLAVLWTAEYQKATGPALRAYAPNGVVNDLVFGTFASGPETARTIRQDTPSYSDAETFYISQNITYDTSIGMFNLMASYKDYDANAIQDADYTDITPADNPSSLKQALLRDEATESFYVEALWTSPEDRPLTWIGGVSYFDETFEFSRVFESDVDLDFFLGAPGYGIVTAYSGLPQSGTKIETKSFSVFGELTYRFTDDLSAYAGLRWTQDKKDLTYSQGLLPGSDPVLNGILATLFGGLTPSYSLQADPDFEFLAPSAGINFKANTNVNLYALYSEGFRAGGFNSTTTDPTLLPYDQETAKNYEVGVKTQWLNGRLGLNLAAFIMEQEDLLVQFDDPNDITYGFYYLGNAGDARTYGVEFEGYARIQPWLIAGASVGYLDAEFTSGTQYPGTSSQFDLTGSKIPYTRDWTLNARVDVDYPVSDLLSLIGSAAIRQEYGGILDATLQSPYENLTKIDLTAGVKLQDATSITAFIDNLTDDRVVQFEYYAGPVATSRGRTFGIQVLHKF